MGKRPAPAAALTGDQVETVREWLKFLCALLVLIAAGEIPPVRAFSGWIDLNRSWLVPLLLGLTVAGLLVLIYGWVIVGIQLGRPMSHQEIERLTARTQMISPGPAYSEARLKGWSRGRTVDPPMEWSFREMKDAWRDGTWWADPGMRLKYFLTAGGVLAILSGFTLILVLSKPPSVKLLIGGAVIYASTRLTLGFSRA